MEEQLTATFIELFERIPYLVSCINSPDKPDNMGDTLKWFSIVAVKSLRDRITYSFL
jgi:hypothetical protein